MAYSSLYVTPKRSRNTSSSSAEVSPEEKRWKSSSSPLITSDNDEVMAALSLTETVTEKLDRILLRITNLDSKMDELNQTVKALQDKFSSLETDVAAVKDKQSTLDNNFSHIEENAKFVDNQIKELQGGLEARKSDISECRKQILYLEAYSRRENLKFEEIPESIGTSSQQNAPIEDTKKVLVSFMEDALGIEDAKDIEFQRVHRMGKARNGGGNSSRTIIARFLRYSDRERVFKCGRKLKGTDYKMFEDIPKELHILRKKQMDKLKKARKEGKRAYFSKSEPDKLYIDGKYVQL